jgi:hypothetical protein
VSFFKTGHRVLHANFSTHVNFIFVKITKPSTVFILNNSMYYLVIKKTQGTSIFAIKKTLEHISNVYGYHLLPVSGRNSTEQVDQYNFA